MFFEPGMIRTNRSATPCGGRSGSNAPWKTRCSRGPICWASSSIRRLPPLPGPLAGPRASSIGSVGTALFFDEPGSGPLLNSQTGFPART